MADTERRSVSGPDGRVIEFLVADPADGLTVGVDRRSAAIPGARVHLMPGDGHLSMTVSAFDRILDDLRWPVVVTTADTRTSCVPSVTWRLTDRWLNANRV